VSECVSYVRPAGERRIIRRHSEGIVVVEETLSLGRGYQEAPRPRPVVLGSDFRFDSSHLVPRARKLAGRLGFWAALGLVGFAEGMFAAAVVAELVPPEGILAAGAVAIVVLVTWGRP
jgi:hypothetical protein